MLRNIFPTKLLAVALFCASAAPWAHAGAEKVLHSFCPTGTCTDGAQPESGLVTDASGNLYGTTYYGGTYGVDGYGVAFELSPEAGGKWKEKVLHNFTNLRGGGYRPVSGLILDANGNLYGTTPFGGSGLYRRPELGGTVFELSPHGDGSWTEKTLYSFCSQAKCSDGQQPSGGLIFDAEGNLYGVTSEGGPKDEGTVFKLSPNGNGSWTETVLYNFCSQPRCADGAGPNSSLAIDANGNLYGVTGQGGTQEPEATCKTGCGTVFELKPSGNGKWSETVLHRFNYTEGATPQCTLVFDQGGNLYGTTTSGGGHTYGAAFQLAPSESGHWNYKVIHNFGSGDDGKYPFAGMLSDASGILYGTTLAGGSQQGGTLYELALDGNEWRETIVHNFDLVDADGGIAPNLPLLAPGGVLYGTTRGGGTSTECINGCGTVFELRP
jgi:uncharacterized repeat protein (TIGR03803 family)